MKHCYLILIVGFAVSLGCSKLGFNDNSGKNNNGPDATIVGTSFNVQLAPDTKDSNSAMLKFSNINKELFVDKDHPPIATITKRQTSRSANGPNLPDPEKMSVVLTSPTQEVPLLFASGTYSISVTLTHPKYPNKPTTKNIPTYEIKCASADGSTPLKFTDTATAILDAPGNYRTYDRSNGALQLKLKTGSVTGGVALSDGDYLCRWGFNSSGTTNFSLGKCFQGALKPGAALIADYPFEILYMAKLNRAAASGDPLDKLYVNPSDLDSPPTFTPTRLVAGDLLRPDFAVTVYDKCGAIPLVKGVSDETTFKLETPTGQGWVDQIALWIPIVPSWTELNASKVYNYVYAVFAKTPGVTDPVLDTIDNVVFKQELISLSPSLKSSPASTSVFDRDLTSQELKTSLGCTGTDGMTGTVELSLSTNFAQLSQGQNSRSSVDGNVGLQLMNTTVKIPCNKLVAGFSGGVPAWYYDPTSGSTPMTRKDLAATSGKPQFTFKYDCFKSGDPTLCPNDQAFTECAWNNLGVLFSMEDAGACLDSSPPDANLPVPPSSGPSTVGKFKKTRSTRLKGSFSCNLKDSLGATIILKMGGYLAADAGTTGNTSCGPIGAQAGAGGSGR